MQSRVLLLLVGLVVRQQLGAIPNVMFVFTLAVFGIIASELTAGGKSRSDLRSVNLRFLGGDKKVPLAGVQVVFTNGYGEDQKKFGPFKLDKAGTANVSLPLGFYSIHLTSEKELPYLPVEKLWDKQTRGPRPDLSLHVADSDVEKWLAGKRRDDGYEQPSEPGRAPRITYTLLPACELVLRAVDAKTGKGLPGAEFYVENAVGEDWAHPIAGENLGAKSSRDNNSSNANTDRTDNEGNFRRFVGANQGFKYGVEMAPAGYELVDPRHEVTIDIHYGKPRAEQIFKFRRIR